MLQYASYFQAVLILYCVSSLFLLFSPINALVYFLSFRSIFAVAAYIGVGSLGGLQYFIPALLCLVMTALATLVRSPLPFRSASPISLYYLFVVLMVFSGGFAVLAGAEPQVFLGEFLKIVLPFSAYVIVFCGIKNEEDLRGIAKKVPYICVLPMLVSLASFSTGTGYNYVTDTFVDLEVGPAGLLIDRNVYGIFLSLCLFLYLPSVLEQRNIKNVAFTIVLLASIIISQNRGTWISLFLAFSASVFLFRHRVRPTKWVLGAAVLLLLAAPIVMARFDQLNQLDAWGQSQDTASGRVEMALDLLGQAAQSPLIGNGPLSFRSGEGDTFLPHDDYVRISCEYGFPAAFVYLMFFLSQLKWSIKRRRDRLWAYQFVGCAGTIYLLILSFAQNIVTDTICYSLLFTLFAAAHRAAAFDLAGQEGATKPPVKRVGRAGFGSSSRSR